MPFPLQLFALALAVGEPEVGELQLDQDWIVGCDNLRFCHAVSLPAPAEGDDFPLGDGNMTVSITRGGGPLDAPIIQLAVIEDIPGVAMSDIRGVLVDNGDTLLDLNSKNGVYDLNANASRRVLKVMKGHNEITLVDAKGKPLARASLKGLMAALAFMDERQFRSDTVSALASPGPKPPNYLNIPPITPPRQVRIAASPNVPPTLLGPAKISELRAQDPCLEYRSDAVAQEPEYHRLDINNSMLILPTKCGGYNPYRQLYVISNDGMVTKPRISLRKSSEYVDDSELPNIGWSEERQRLQSFGRGRVLADCGEIQEFAWSDGRFILTLHSSMTPCRGSRDYITTYRLETVSEKHR